MFEPRTRTLRQFTARLVIYGRSKGSLPLAFLPCDVKLSVDDTKISAVSKKYTVTNRAECNYITEKVLSFSTAELRGNKYLNATLHIILERKSAEIFSW